MSDHETLQDYQTLVLQWRPDKAQRDPFRLWLTGSLLGASALALGLTLLEPAERPSQARPEVPERVARFMRDRPQPEPAEPEPRREPKPPPPAEPEPVVERERPERAAEEPVTEEEKVAREEAESSGLLAMREELDGLMDTSDVDDMVDTGSRGGSGVGEASAGYGDGDLAQAQGRSGAEAVAAGVPGGVDNPLARRPLADVSRPDGEGEDDASTTRDDLTGTGRSDEEVSLVFDRHKSALYSLYNRARRRTPGLEGQLVVEVTIAPSGAVEAVDIVSSELDNPSLEQRIRNRILQFQFKGDATETITVIYPIEFLPS